MTLPAVPPLRGRSWLARLLLGGSRGGVAGVLAAEAIDATLRVHEAMLARVERVAGSTDIDLELVPGRARLELVAAGAAHVNDLVLGVDAVFHFSFLPASCAKRRWGAEGDEAGASRGRRL